MAAGEQRTVNRLRIPFFKRFSLVGGFVFVLVILVAHLYYSVQTTQALRARMQEKSVFINNFLAYTFSSALATKDDVTLLQIIDQLTKDPDVLSVVVGDDHGQIRYSADQNKIGDDLDDPDMLHVFQSGEPITKSYRNAAGEAMELVAPLKVQGRNKPLGTVRIDMTFKGVDEKLQKWRDSFLFYAISLFILGMTLSGTALQLWVARPIHILKNYLRTITPANADINLPESSDELGQLYASINEMVLKFKSEIQSLAMMQAGQTLQDAELVHRVTAALKPDSRIIIADRDNQIVVDSEPGVGESTAAHLLDVLHGESFATIVRQAFGQIGEAAHGTLTLQDQLYEATIIRFPETFSKGVRTLILLTKNKETSNS